MKAKKKMTGLLILGMAALVYPSSAQDALRIIQNMDKVLYAPSDMSATQSIILVDKNGREETREATILQKGTDKRIMRFTSPASQAGIAVLALPNDVMYMYLPAFGKERRISASVKNQNFAGTDFSYDDMEPKPYAEKYTAELLRTEGNIHVVQLLPRGRSDYSRIVAYINGTDYYPEAMEYYDRGNTLVKEAKYSFKKVGKYWSTNEIALTNLKKDHKTIMRMSDVKYDLGLSDDEFTVRKLKQ